MRSYHGWTFQGDGRPVNIPQVSAAQIYAVLAITANVSKHKAYNVIGPRQSRLPAVAVQLKGKCHRYGEFYTPDSALS